MLGYDYSARAISPAALKAAGCQVALRYVSTVGNPKNITKTEYAQLGAAGIQVGLVFETSAGWMLGGYSAGVAAAHSARAQATAAGYPADHALWYAADFDTSAHAGDVATVMDCLRGCAAAEGSAGLVRIYGNYAVVEAAAAAGFVQGWQTVAWSGGKRSSHANIYQTGKTGTCDGVQVDINQISTDFDLGGDMALTTADAQLVANTLLDTPITRAGHDAAGKPLTGTVTLRSVLAWSDATTQGTNDLVKALAVKVGAIAAPEVTVDAAVLEAAIGALLPGITVSLKPTA